LVVVARVVAVVVELLPFDRDEGNPRMNTSEIFGLATSIVVLAGISVAIVNGGNTARVLTAMGSTFNNALRTATRGGK
jgi:hypothetical protein